MTASAVTLAPAPADKAALRAAAAPHARGDYQRALLTGHARWSGADLTGAAKKWSGRYAASRSNLLHRLRGAGLPVSVERVKTRSGRWAVALCLNNVPVSAVP